jgi:ligand-binding SRPBCC domain-containing protein
LWVHEHRFEARGEGTQCFDRVEYAVPGGPGIERVVERLFVRRDLESIFEFRRRQMEDWAREARPATH